VKPRHVLVRARRAAALLTAALLLAGCAAQMTNSRGLRLIEEGDPEKGLALLQEAARLEPGNSRYRIDYLTQQSRLVRELLGRADDARRGGDLAAARGLVAAAARLDPASERVRIAQATLDQEQRQRERIAEADRLAGAGQLEAARDMLRAAAADNPNSPAVQRALAQVQERLERAVAARQAQVAAQSVMKKPVTLQFRDANVRMVFEAMSRTTGLNVIMDRDVRADLKTTIFVRDASVEDTVDLILLQNQLEKKVLNANTLFIYPATSAKQKEYQDLKVRTFQLSNADAKYVQSLLKTVLKVKDVALDERSNTLVIRDTADAIAVAEKIVAAHDNADAEVMLEVEVLEVSRDRLSNLGIKWPDSMSLATPTDANGQLTLGQLRDITSSQLLVSPLSGALNLKLQDTDANLLASPRIRARHKEKAKILIGDKVPVITNTVTPVSTGTPVVTGSVQYLDVGIKLEVEPHIYLEGDVGIKLNLEVSNIAKEIAGPNGSLAYQIGTRSAQTNLRLKDGETQILGGLINDQDRNTASKVPGLGQLPLLGRLFSNHNGTTNKTEIVLSITPRIVRAPRVVDSRYRDVFSGTESSVREAPLRLDPVGSVRGAGTGLPAVAPGAARAAPPGAAGGDDPAHAVNAASNPAARGAAAPGGSPGNAPATASSSAAPAAPSPVGSITGGTPAPGADEPPPAAPRPATPMPAPAATPSAPVDPSALPPSIRPGGIYKPAPPPQPGAVPRPAPPAGPGERVDAGGGATQLAAVDSGVRAAGAGTAAGPSLELTWRGPYRVKVGETFTVAVEAQASDTLRRLPLVVRFDPMVLTFLDAQLDEFASKSGVPSIKPAVDEANGRIAIDFVAAGGRSFSGRGTLVQLRFSARAPRQQTQLAITPINLKEDGGALRDVVKPAPMTMRVGS
jgi:general secretion pathway protein D